MRLTSLLLLVALSPGLLAQGSDDCSSAQPITGTGTWFFDNTSASTDGEANDLCSFLGGLQIRNDVWFRWTPTLTGPYWVQTCNQTTVDTRLAIYGADCSTEMVACDDDGCGYQSRLYVAGVEGEPILIRLGNYPGAFAGVGRLAILPAFPVLNPDNGNHYQIAGVRTTWQEARVQATQRVHEGVPGHLAAITSAGENNFIYNVLGASALDEYWLGGRQNPSASDYSEPGGGYRWLTGEQLSGAYENWAPGEPNDAGAGEDSVAYVKAAEWADIEGTSLINEGYVIEFPTGALVGESFCIAVANSTGFPANIYASGSDSLADNYLTLFAFPCPDQPGLFYFGPFQALVPLGNGFRCVGGQLRRFPPAPGDAGYLRQTLNFAGDPLLSPITAGSTWYFQAWYRDLFGGGAYQNLTDGLEITFAP